MAFPRAELCKDSRDLFKGSHRDAVIVVSPELRCVRSVAVEALLKSAAGIDKRLGQQVVLIHAPEVAGGRLIHSPTGPLKRDFDDVRCVADAAAEAVSLAVQSGAVSPMLVVEGMPATDDFSRAIEVAYLAMGQRLWQPLEARESLGDDRIEPVQSIGLLDMDDLIDAEYLNALESGRRLARDLAGTEPERMAPPKFASYCAEALENSKVSIEIVDDQDEIRREFPLLAAVARASQPVARHRPRIIRMSYTGEGPIEKTLFLVGKAVTFDTGGVDIKVGGHMAGMSRDKGGGAAVVGFMKALAEIEPKGLKVVAFVSAVRNSIGADAFVSDEIIESHAGLRVRIANTDAEGRLAMADALSHCRLLAKNAVAPEIMTIATLTGHAALSVGPYTALVENATARDQGFAQGLSDMGDLWGECMEVNRSRREDWQTNRARSSADDVLSANNGPSVSAVRGHQFPMAFLSTASGLDEHGLKSAMPLPYIHMDIAGSGVEDMDWQHGKPTAAPVVALAAHYLLS